MIWTGHTLGLDVLGADDYYGPMSPDDLAKLDRKLTSAEQAAVDEWQSRQADQQLATERKKGGPQSATVSVTPQGAVIKSLVRPTQPVLVQQAGFFAGMTWWQVALLVLGGSAVGYGFYKAVK